MENTLNRTEIINLLVKKIKAESYLEIGVASGANFDQIECLKKTGVDPNPDSPATFNQLSDDFFLSNDDIYDLIFIDGLHHSEQVEKDISNALKFLSEDGIIVCHDMNPKEEMHQAVPRVSSFWNGDCWKAWVLIRSQRADLEMFVVDVDSGCGIIKAGKQDPLLVGKDDLNWDNFSKNKKDWLNLISEEDFFKKVFAK